MIQEDQQNILSSGNTNQEAIQNIEAQNLLTQANKIIEVNQDEQIKLNKNKQEENECVYKIEQLVQKIAQLPLVNNQKKFQDLKKALLQLFCNLQIQPKLIGEQIQIFLIEIGKLIDQQPKNCQDQNQKFSLQQLSDIEAYIQNIHTHSQNMPLNQLQQLQTYFENRQKEQDTIPKDLQKVFSQNQKALEIHKKILQLLQVNPDILTNLIEDLLQYLHKIVLQYQNEPEQYQYMLMEFEKILKIFQKEFEQTNQMLEQLFKIQNQVVDLLGQSNLNEGYGNSVLQQYLNQSYQQNILKLLQIYRSLSYKQTHYLYDSSKLKVINLQKEESKQHERSLNSIESSQEFQEKDKQNNKEIQSLDISNPIIGEEFQKQINSPSSSQDNEQDGKKNQKIALKQLNNIQQIKKIIKDYAFQDQDLQFQNEEEILKDGEGLQQFTPQRQWSKDTFIKNNNFDNQKSYIIDKLLENKLYLCQSLAQNEREDLFIGYKNFNSGIYQDLLIKIKFNPSVQELTKDILVMQTLDFSFDHIQIEQNNTHVLFLSLEECIQIDKKLELFVLAIESILNFSKIEKNLEIDFEDIQKQQKQQNQFQISTEFLKVFFKDQKYYICEFYNKENHGIMLQANKNLIIQSFQDYIFNSIFIMDESFSYQQNAAFSLNEEKINQKEDKTSQMQDTSTENDHFTQNKSKNQDQSKSLEGENKQENLKDKDLYQQINQYKYNEFQVQINQQSPQDFNEIQIKKTKREWSEVKFQISNKNQNLNENFLNRKMIIERILKSKQYFLCKCLVSNQNENIFIGYQENIDGGYNDYIFVIKQNSTSQDIEEYLIVKKFNEEINHFILQDNTCIFILQKNTFIQYHKLHDKLSSMVNWSKQWFIQLNALILNKKSCNACDECQQQQKCYNYLPFRKFNKYKEEILNKLLEKNYHLCKYVNKGGFGIVFEGYQFSLQNYQELAFKIQFGLDFQEEIDIMKLFEKHGTSIKLIDQIKLNEKIEIIILEKCKWNLNDELESIQKQNQFSKEKLIQMLAQLIDGLVQFRIYNILHLDIKPSNILVTNLGNYVYTDFGISQIRLKNKLIEFKGLTPNYSSPEQKNNDPNIDYRSDIYSLGKVFEQITKCYEKVQPNDKQTVKILQNLIEEHMTQEDPSKRLNCIELNKLILEKSLEIDEFQLKSYLQILDLNPYDKYKDIPLFQEIQLQYYLNYLDVVKKNQKQISNSIQKKSLDKFIALTSNYVSQVFANIGDYQKALQYQLESLRIYKQIFKEDHPTITAPFNSISACFQNTNFIKKGLEFQSEFVKNYEEKLKENYIDISNTLNYVSLIYFYNGDNNKALQFSLESLKLRKLIYKDNHLKIAESINNFSLCLQNIGEYQKALDHSFEALNIYKQIDQNNPNIPVCLNNISMCYKGLSQYQKSLEYQLESLKIFEQLYNQIHPLIATSLNNLSFCYEYLANFEMALEYQFKSYNMRKQLFKEVHPEIASSLSNIGSLYQNLNENKKALEYNLESLKMYKQIFKQNHPHISVSLNNVSISYRALGEIQKALEYSQESLKMRKQLYKQAHPSIAQSLSTVGQCYFDLDQKQKALECFLESLQINKQLFGNNNLAIAESLNELGVCYQHFHENKKAIECLLESLKIKKQIFKENHPLIAQSLNNVGMCYLNSYNIKNAEEYLLESLRIRKLIFEENHLLIAESLNNLSICYKATANKQKALELSLEALQIFQKKLDENHPKVATSLNNVGSLYLNIGEYQMAITYLQQSLKIFKSIFQENHQYVLITLNNIANCYLYLKDSKSAFEYFNQIQEIRNKFKN